MAASTPKDAAIPRYLRYKSEEKKSDDYWDEELERANSILHNRVVRMQRDKLCTGCARFDFLRTHFYTRECIPRDKAQAAECQKVKNDAKRPVNALPARNLLGMRDNVNWYCLETFQGVEEGVRLLAQHPEFMWKLGVDDELVCTICSMLFDAGKAMLIQPLLPHSWYLVVGLRSGAFFEEGGQHKCREASEQFTYETTNTIVADISLSEDGGLTYMTCRTIGPITEYLDNVIGNIHQPMPHCCILQHNVQANVDFDRLSDWIQTCDTRHKHTSDILTAPRELFAFRLVDVKNQCIVERDIHTRYAALSYTWGASGQYCLATSNISLLERQGSLEQIGQELRPIVVDSMMACTRLGIAYLWVDALCIVQDDAAGKHQQIQNMDIIYEGAYITFVAAGDEIESYPSEQISGTGLARVTLPAVSPRQSFTVDGVLYSFLRYPPLFSLGDDLENSTWFSRGWTFQEFVLSRRILVFTAREVFFYCPNGILCESVTMGGDQYESFPLNVTSHIKLCGAVNTSLTSQSPSTIFYSVQYYRNVYLTLLGSYTERVLTYDDDVLDAFSGVLNAQLGVLGQFYWGLPQGLFARALLLSNTISPTYTMSRRPGFPSWSWLGWKFDQPGRHGIFYDPIQSPFFPLVYIYKHDAQSSTELLVGPMDDQGIEGCCVGYIDHYNTTTELDPLPTLPCIEKVPKFPQLLGQDSLPVLLFWTHVARFTASAIKKSCAAFRITGCGDWKARIGNAQIEIILIALAESDSGDTHIHGIVIERHMGYARHIGTVLHIALSTWLDGNPKKELILLI